MFLKFLIPIILIVSVANVSTLPTTQLDEDYGSRIVNGTLAKIGEFPYIVALNYAGEFNCAGSILDNRHILTAGHCVYGFDTTLLSIVYGSNKRTNKNTEVRVEKAIVHESYAPWENYANDVSVLRLEKDIPFDKYAQPTKLPQQDMPTPGGDEGILAGWGRPSDLEPAPEDLYKASLIVYSDEYCARLHNGNTDGRYHICAGIPEGGRGQCSGDSGGPLYANGVQVGTVSWSVKPCAVKGFPGVYAKVASYVNWIQQQMKEL